MFNSYNSFEFLVCVFAKKLHLLIPVFRVSHVEIAPSGHIDFRRSVAHLREVFDRARIPGREVVRV
jgi:hypothetical protein